jgi:hypothetical protein
LAALTLAILAQLGRRLTLSAALALLALAILALAILALAVTLARLALAWILALAILALPILALPILTLPVLALPLLALARILALAILALSILTLAILTLALWALRVRTLTRLRAIVLVTGVAHPRQALPARGAGIHRGGQALADILHVDVGDRQFAASDPRALPVIHRRQDSVIVIGVLQEIFRRHPIAGGAGIAGELEIFFQNLIGVAANACLVAATFVALPLVVTAAATTHAVRFARTTPTRASIIIVLLHLNVTSSSTVIEMAGQAACPSSRRIQQYR